MRLFQPYLFQRRLKRVMYDDDVRVDAFGAFVPPPAHSEGKPRSKRRITFPRRRCRFTSHVDVGENGFAGFHHADMLPRARFSRLSFSNPFARSRSEREVKHSVENDAE